MNKEEPMNMAKPIIRIGAALRQPHWTECAVVVSDVGKHSFWGRIVDLKTEKWVSEGCYSMADKWFGVVFLAPWMEN